MVYKQYLTQCDRLRSNYENGENLWQEMMRNKAPESEAGFLATCDMSKILDADELPEDYLKCLKDTDPDFGFYSSKLNGKDCSFFQVAGFEFIFMQEADFPKKK